MRGTTEPLLLFIHTRHQKFDQQSKNERDRAQCGHHIVLGGKLIAFVHDDVAKKYHDRKNGGQDLD